MKQNKCGAKNKKTCRYHGIKEFADEQRAGQEVLEALDKTSTFLINRKQRKELLRETYTVDTFLDAEDYNVYTTYNQLNIDPKAKKFFEAESEWQDNWLKENNEENKYKAMKLTIWKMTVSEDLNVKLRNGQDLSDDEGQQIKNLDEIYANMPERGIPNRLFRGFSFNSKADFDIWLQSRLVSDGQIQLDEYTRTSSHGATAFSFATKRNYPVIFEYISSKGIYTDKFTPANQEREVILNREEKFTLEGSYETTIYDHNIAAYRTIAVVQLRGD